ncbi:MAG: TIM-barrel domain-containing protein, partial [Candidatus Woesearchaeota archaeon]
MNINSEEIIDRNKESAVKEKIFELGEILSFNKEENFLKLNFNKEKVILEFVKSDIIRVIMDKKEEINLKTTYAVVNKDKYSNFKINESEEFLQINTNDLKIIINKSSFSLKFYNKKGELLHEDATPALSWSKNKIKVTKKTSDNEYFYGLGEKTAFLNKKGKKYTMWNTDVFESHIENTDPLYASIPFYLVASKKNNYGIYFDNSYKSHFDFRIDEDGKYSFWAEGGKMDYYFINGPEAKEVIDKYTDLTGKMPLPPKWSLGYHQSRYSYKNEKKVKKLANKFREKEIPCDVIHLDIHYMDDYRVFTWDNNRFPEAENMIKELKEDGFNIVNIIDPGVKKDADYDVYKEGVKNDYFCKYLDGEIYSGDVWPGESVFP